MSDIHVGDAVLPMPGVWIWLILAVLVGLMLKFTRFGRHIYAVGSNENTARLCGINVEKTKLLIYMLAIALGGVAGVLRFSWLGMGDPMADIGTELLVIASVVIGGASLSGGVGGIGGTIIGTLIIMIVYQGCTVLGLPNFVQEIVTGAIIVAAVTLDQMRHKKSE
jgi:ribose/xylose/arabinose/galactoside ABC-type transport system permease subunit